MGIARTTVAAIYESAWERDQLLIRGGNYRLNDQGTKNIIQKETGNMRIAVTNESGEISIISAIPSSSRSTMWRMAGSLRSRSSQPMAMVTVLWLVF